MNQNTETTAVTDFILQSDRNLRIAAAINSEWNAAKATIVAGFCSRLEAELKMKLPSWRFEDWGLLTTRRGSWAVWKPSWEGQYYILIQPENHGVEMFYGILRDEKSIAKRPFSPELLAAIKQQISSARSKSWWEAIIKFESPAPDSQTAEALWQMHTQEKFLQEVALQLLQLAKLSEKHIDVLVEKYRGKK